jgi:anaerobic ribonucleoside-triphosphate reductase
MTEICKIHEEAILGRACMSVVPGIDYCGLCGNPMCPVCKRHLVTQLSRVTGYIQDVSGWNRAKQQELRDRKKYSLR